MRRDPDIIPPVREAVPVQPSPAWLRRVPGVERLYRRYERYVPIIVFATGFIWDSLTMVRIDNKIDIAILVFYLVALAVMIFFTLRRQSGRGLPGPVSRLEPYFLSAMQFAFGGLFSAFVIFYFKSASWTRTQFFFMLLVCLLVGNEFLQHRLNNPKLLAVLYSFCLLSFLAFFLPILFARVNPALFVLSGALSLLVTGGVFAAGSAVGREELSGRRWPVFASIAGVCVSLNLLYFANLIPPVPLALKTAGIYHRVVRTQAGYEVHHVRQPFYRFWRQDDEPFQWAAGQPVYCFTSVFAPRDIRVPVHHVWSQYSPALGWHVTDRISYDISGGREDGYRGYTWKRTIWPGRWRVEVETDRGQILGRVDFTVVPSPAPPALVTRLIR